MVNRSPRLIHPVAIAAAAFAFTSTARGAAETEAITSPIGVAPGAVRSPFATSARHSLGALSLSAADRDSAVLAETEQSSSGATNFRGERVAAAPVRYQEDFEGGEIGPEWGAFGGIVEHGALTRYADSSIPGGMKLNVKTETDTPYEVRLDVYLVPPSNSAQEDSDDNVLSVFVDDHMVQSFSAGSLLKLSGQSPTPGEPLVRTIHIPFTSSHRIAEVRIESTARGSEGWSGWGIDNLVIDLGLQDPVFGVIGGGGGYEPGLFDAFDLGAGMTGEIPGLPKNRYGRNEPFSGDGGGGGSSPRRLDDPADEDRDDDRIDDDEEKPDRAVPAGPTALLFIAAAVTLLRRKRA